jgi:hypothetical protein
MRDEKKIVSKEGLDTITKSIQETLGGEIVGAMGKANIRNPQKRDDPFQYPRVPYKNLGVLGGGEGYLDPNYWKKIQKYSFILKAGKKPSDAVKSAFQGPTRLECLGTTRAVLAKGLLDTLGEEDFDKHFAYKSDDDPGVVIGTNTAPRDRVAELMYRPQASSPDDLIKGDWIYYQNDVRYPEKHPDSLWMGENCIYEGNNKFSGFGLSGMTLQALKTSMERAFKENPTQRDIAMDPRLDSSHQNYKKAIAEAKDPKVVGLRYDSLQRFQLKKFLL